MRNGNSISARSPLKCPRSSYPTYEEWKHVMNQKFCYFTIVLILPMRNGNENGKIYIRDEKGNCSYPTYEEWKQQMHFLSI